MEDVTTIDFTKPYGKIADINVAKQKVFYTQNGIDYGVDGKAINKKQVEAYYARKVAEAQAIADEAKAFAAEAQADANTLAKSAGVTKAAVKKAAKA